MTTTKNAMDDLLAAMRAELRDELRAEMHREFERLRAEVGPLDRPMCMTPAQACTAFGFSRPTFDRWLADPRSGLEVGPEPAVMRPNGRGGKVLVHAARMQAWLDGRGPWRRARPSRTTA